MLPKRIYRSYAYHSVLARDHGIPGYNFYREFCNMTKAKNFSDLHGEVSEHLVKMLSEIYDHVDDIDLFPGAMSEIPLPGGILTPTFACIVGHQFRRIRSCDRFWYMSLSLLN